MNILMYITQIVSI